MTEKQDRDKGRKWDGRSRPSNDLYKKNYDKIFNKKEKTLSELLQKGFEKEQAEENDK